VSIATSGTHDGVSRSACARDRARFLHDAVRGLSARPKWLDSKYLYDEEGSRLFEAITRTSEYYPTRRELEILRCHAAEIGALLGPGCLVLAPGSGNGVKLRALLAGLQDPSGVVTIDLGSRRDGNRFTWGGRSLPTTQIAADFCRPIDLPPLPSTDRRVLFFGGSTIGNFTPVAAAGLLRRFADLAGDRGTILVGHDLPKDVSTLLRAYDDAAGITAAFNLNLLARMNRELGADFDLRRFHHVARWSDAEHRIEMHLRSNTPQTAHIGAFKFRFGEGETIHTENAYKWSTDEFRSLVDVAELRIERTWSDARGHYALECLRPASNVG
jgi:dimethylhistidine N-methyltransferase